MYHFIINPHSKTGRAREYWLELKQILEENSIEYKSYFTKGRNDATKIASDLCNTVEGIKKIIIVGGDGTANEVINGLGNYKDVLLGYIPLGSSNDLARGLQLPKNPKQALDLILHPKNYRYVDHGEVHMVDSNITHRFAVSSGIGYDAAVCEEVLTSPLKKFLNKLRIGKLVYIMIAFKQIFTHKFVEADIIVDNHRHIHTNRLLFMTSLIHKYEGGGLLMAPEAIDNDQKLCVCLVSDISRFKVLFLMPTIFFGKHTKLKGISMIECNTIEIKTKEPMVVHTDGEVAGHHNHLKLQCLPTQIRMYS